MQPSKLGSHATKLFPSKSIGDHDLRKPSETESLYPGLPRSACRKGDGENHQRDTEGRYVGNTKDFPPALGLPHTLPTENSNLRRPQKRLNKQSTYSSGLPLCFPSFSLNPHFNPEFIIALAFPQTMEKDVTLHQRYVAVAHSAPGK